MIAVPERGLLDPQSVLDVQTGVLADWLEANLLFWEPRITSSDVVDSLLAYETFAGDQDYGYEIASRGWHELEQRMRWGGTAGALEIESGVIETEADWQESLIWSFFVLLSIQRVFPTWARGHADYPTQGDLFEQVVETICPAIFPGWCSYRTGWSPGDSKDVSAIVDELRSRIYVLGHPNAEQWLEEGSKDGGLDIVCYRPFADEREALPAYFLQCASGRNWRDKVTTPNATVWQKVLDAAVQPSTGIAAPFVVGRDELRRAALQGQTIVLDRLRMLSSATKAGISLPKELGDRVRDWMRPRVESLLEQ